MRGLNTAYLKIFFSAALVLCFALANSQPSEIIEGLKPWQLKGFAKKSEMNGDIYSAIDFWTKYHELKPNKGKIYYNIAELYREARDYKMARDFYQKAYNHNKGKNVKALYYFALMTKMTGDYQGSYDPFNNFKKEYKTGKEAEVFKKLIRANLAGNDSAKIMMENPEKVLVFHLDTSVNKAHIEFSPMPVDEEHLLYASYKTDKIEYYNPDSAKAPGLRQFYVAKKSDDNWVADTKWDVPFNQNDGHIGNGVFSPDGERFYFTKLEKNWKNEYKSSIYMSRLVGSEWQEPEKLPEPINVSKYTSTMPAVGTESRKNNEVLYFVSDRSGGKGGLDIWYITYDKRKDQWVKLKNCGSKLNTAGDEVTPYFDMELRRLYFSSDGHYNIGGLDVFKSTGEESRWMAPVNMGFPINSSADDLYYVPGKNKEIAFLTSNREGGVSLKNPTCCDDIYYLKWTEYIKIFLKGFTFELVERQIPDSLRIDSAGVAIGDSIVKEQVDLDGVTVKLYLLDKETAETFFITSFETACKEEYVFKLEPGNQYKLIAEKPGYFSDAAKVSTFNLKESTELRQDFVLRKIPSKSIILENIYYEYDKWDLTESAKASIDSTLLNLLYDNQDLVIEIGSHTDSKGKEDYNQKLSQKRAESVVNYLIEKGIDKSRLMARGYGEMHPIADNNFPDGRDNPDGRAKNRRTEFTVVGSAVEDDELKSGKVKIIYREGDHTKTIDQ